MPHEFERVLAECLEELEGGAVTLEQCLARHPTEAAELRPLLESARALRTLQAVHPRPAFQAGARARLLQRLAPRPASPAWGGALLGILRSVWQPPLRTFSRRLTAAWAQVSISARVLAVVTGVGLSTGVGMVYASGQALPGETLYPVKLAVEEARVATVWSTTAKVALHTEFADRRLLEAQRLLAAGKPTEANQALQNYATEIKTAGDYLRAEPNSQTAQVMADQLAQAMPTHTARLDQLEEHHPTLTQPQLDQAHAASDETWQTVQSVRSHGNPSDKPTPVFPSTPPVVSTPPPPPIKPGEATHMPEPTHAEAPEEPRPTHVDRPEEPWPTHVDRTEEPWPTHVDRPEEPWPTHVDLPEKPPPVYPLGPMPTRLP